jgi:hypothetical protein
MGAEDITDLNPLGFVPVEVTPENAEELLAAAQKATEEEWIAAQAAIDAGPQKLTAKQKKELGL